MFRNVKTREITVGADNKVEQCVYVAALTRVEEEIDNELTGGWKVIEVSKVPRHICQIAHVRLPDGSSKRQSIPLG